MLSQSTRSFVKLYSISEDTKVIKDSAISIDTSCFITILFCVIDTFDLSLLTESLHVVKMKLSEHLEFTSFRRTFFKITKDYDVQCDRIVTLSV